VKQSHFLDCFVTLLLAKTGGTFGLYFDTLQKAIENFQVKQPYKLANTKTYIIIFNLIFLI